MRINYIYVHIMKFSLTYSKYVSWSTYPCLNILDLDLLKKRKTFSLYHRIILKIAFLFHGKWRIRLYGEMVFELPRTVYPINQRHIENTRQVFLVVHSKISLPLKKVWIDFVTVLVSPLTEYDFKIHKPFLFELNLDPIWNQSLHSKILLSCQVIFKDFLYQCIAFFSYPPLLNAFLWQSTVHWH